MHERFAEVDIAKGLTMLLVILEHSIIDYPIDLHNIKWCADIQISLNSFFMPCFFLLSGFLFAKSSKPTKVVLFDKVKRLLVPWFFITFITQLAKVVNPSMAHYKEDGFGSIIRYAFLYAGDRWFVYILFWVFIFSLILRPLIKKDWIKLLFIALLVLNEFVIKIKIPEPIYRSLYYFIFFLIGEIIRNNYDKIRPFLTKHWYIPVLAFFALNIYFVADLADFDIIYKYFIPVVGSIGMLTVSILFTSNKLERFSSYLNDGISYIGKYSLQYYLLAGFVLAPLRLFLVTYLHWTLPIPIILVCFFGQIIIMTIAILIIKRIRLIHPLFGL